MIFELVLDKCTGVPQHIGLSMQLGACAQAGGKMELIWAIKSGSAWMEGRVCAGQ